MLAAVDERAEALHELSRQAPEGSRYRVGRYLFTRDRIYGLPHVDIVIPPGPSFSEPPVPLFRHRFNAIHVEADWLGYYHDEEVGHAYRRHRGDSTWVLTWIGYLFFDGPRPRSV